MFLLNQTLQEEEIPFGTVDSKFRCLKIDERSFKNLSGAHDCL